MPSRSSLNLYAMNHSMRPTILCPSSFLSSTRKTVDEKKDEIFATWYGSNGEATKQYTFGELWEEAGAISNHLCQHLGLKKGDRVVLCYNFGLHFFASFLGCLRVGVVAVLVYPPGPPLVQSLAKMNKVIADCNPKLILTDSDVSFLRSADLLNPLSRSRHLWPKDIKFVVTDKINETKSSVIADWLVFGGGRSEEKKTLPEDLGEDASQEDLAFLQYTSGSTGDPKGVMVTFGALAANVNLIHEGFYQCFREDGGIPKDLIGFSWLPQYHDLGLIYAAIAPFAGGWRMHMMSPIDFVKNPLLWLDLMSRHRVHWGVAPDFAFHLVARKFIEARDKNRGKCPIPGLDLSCLHNLQNGTEPIKPSTAGIFNELFASYGLRKNWFHAGYGLAENVVGVCWIHGYHTSSPRDEDVAPIVAVGSKRNFHPSLVVKIVDTSNSEEVNDGVTGELWIAGPSVAAGYYRKPELTEQLFQAKMKAARSMETKRFLRTGDLAFFQNDKLYICGRIKDLVIINGVNYYPQDIEHAVQEASPAVRPGCVAAFSSSDTSDGAGGLEIVFEIRNQSSNDAADVIQKVRRSVIEIVGLVPFRIVAIKERSIPKTTSGKIQRRASRLSLHAEKLNIVAEDEAAMPDPSCTVQEGNNRRSMSRGNPKSRLQSNAVPRLPPHESVLQQNKSCGSSSLAPKALAVIRAIKADEHDRELRQNRVESTNKVDMDSVFSRFFGDRLDYDLSWEDIGLSSMVSVQLRDMVDSSLLVTLPPDCFELYPTPKALKSFVERDSSMSSRVATMVFDFIKPLQSYVARRDYRFGYTRSSAAALGFISVCSLARVPYLIPFLRRLLVLIIFLLFVFQQVVLRVGRTIFKEETVSTMTLKPLTEVEREKHNEDVLLTSAGSLPSLWQAYTKERPMVALITGVTGYVGRAVLYEILCQISNGGSSGHRIFIVVRAKRDGSGHLDIKERVRKIRGEAIFTDFLELWDKVVEVIETTDLGIKDCGISAGTIDRLIKFGVEQIVHSAADVDFLAPLDRIAISNISSTLELQSLARRFGCCRFVYVSTVFVNPKCGSASEPNKEELFTLGKYDPVEIYHSMVGDQWLAEKVKKEYGFQNNYVLTKCIAEHLLARDTSMRLSIIRPGIVGPAWMRPYTGWNGDQPSTSTAFLFNIRTGMLQAHHSAGRHAGIPVDFVAVAVVEALLSIATSAGDLEQNNAPALLTVRNCVFDINIFKPCLHFWALTGRFSTTKTVIHYLINRGIRVRPYLLTTCDLLFHRLPLYVLAGIQQLQQWIGLQKSGRLSARQSLGFTGMVHEIAPFSSRTFHFQSSVRKPQLFCQDRYLLCAMLPAVESFLPRVYRQVRVEHESSTEDFFQYVNLVPRKRFDFWWAMTQPNGNLMVRIIAFLTAKLLRWTCGDVLVDLRSTAALAEALAKEWPTLVCLAPTHRSFLDFVLVSYVCFSIPGLSLKLPHIAAASQFRDLSFSFLLRWAHAFWIERGRRDEGLSRRLRELVDKGESLMVFLEGTRSRDRRFLSPRTGFLKALQEASASCGGTLLVPITLDYERVPEHVAFENHLVSMKTASNLSTGAFLQWLWQAVFKGDIQLGDVRITFASPVWMKNGDDASAVANEVQSRQRLAASVTLLHLKTAEQHLGIQSTVLHSALIHLGCSVTPVSDLASKKAKISAAECWSLHMQWLHLLAPLLRETHPKWVMWILGKEQLDHCFSDNGKYTKMNHANTSVVVARLKSIFDEADVLAASVDAMLTSKGIPMATLNHITGEIAVAEKVSECITPPITTAAARFLLEKKQESNRQSRLTIHSPAEETPVQSVFLRDNHDRNTKESLGKWGFVDSGFILRETRPGQLATVRFKGARYRISGRDFPTLLQIFETDLGIRIDSVATPMLSGHCPIQQSDGASLPSDIAKTVAEILKQSGFSTVQMTIDSQSRSRHGTGHALEDMYNLRSGKMHRVPDVVVWPTDEVDCVKLVDVAAKHSLCLVPFGGGTNVTRATWCPSFDVDPRPMVSVDMRRMNKIIWINKEDGLAHIEAGMVGRDMCTELAKHGLTVGHEPDSIEFSTLGGWVATRASGMKRNRYGNIEDIVREVRLVTSTGIMSQHHHNDPISEDGGSKSAFARTSIGTELKDLVLGSEGNLGIISSVVVRVHPLPGKTDYGSILFPSFDVGLDFMRDLARLPSALRPASVRLADHTQFVWGGHLSSDRTSLKRQVAKLYLTSWLHWDPESICGCSILYEGTDDEVGIQKKFVNQLVSKYKALSTGSAHGAAGYDLTFAIGYIRDFAISHYVLGESFETFVPWSCCRALCQRVKEDVKLAHKQRSLPGKPTISCRITQLYGEGACVYFYLAIYVKGVASPCSAFAEMEKEARNSCLRHGGSLSHHHGVGKVRAPYLSTVNSPGLTQWLRQMKQNVDASNIFGVSNGVCAREDTPKDIIGEVD